MSIKVKINNDWVDTNIQAVRGVNHVNSEDVYTKEETEKKFATKTEVQTQINNLQSDADNKFATKESTDTKVAKTDIVQSVGNATDKIMSQKTVSDSLNTKADKTELKKYAKKSDMTQYIEAQTIYATELNADDLILADISLNDTLNAINTNVDQKVDKTDITQSTGTSETAVMSQKAVSDALSNVYTKAESDAMYLRGEVLYEDCYYPNMGETTDKVNFSDSTEILQPTKFIGEYTDENGQTYNCVFECESFPDWFEYSDKACYPYDNGISVANPFFKNYTIDNGELVYDFSSMQNIDISKKLPHFTENVGLKKIDDNHFNLYTQKSGVDEFTAFDKDNVDCSLFAFSPVTYNPIYDVDDCKLVRITLTGNIKSPSRYSSLLDNNCDVGLIGYTNRQVLYGDEYVEIEIDKNNNRWRQVKSGYSMFYRSGYSQNWSANKPESYESECRCLWIKPNGAVGKICMINKKICFSFASGSNPLTILQMGCKIKIEKLA